MGLALEDRCRELAISQWRPFVLADLYSSLEGVSSGLVYFSPLRGRDMDVTLLETGRLSLGGYPWYHISWFRPGEGSSFLAVGSSSGAFLPSLFVNHSSVLSFNLEAFIHKMNLAM